MRRFSEVLQKFNRNKQGKVDHGEDLELLALHLQLQNTGDLSLRVKEITDLLDILTVGSYLPAVLKCLDMFKLVCATTAEISKLNETLENVRAGRGEIKVGVLTVEIKRILRNLTGEHLRFFDVLVHCEPLVDFLRKQVRFSE